jgi:hypothetical protein
VPSRISTRRRFDPLHPPTSFDQQVALTDFSFRGMLADSIQGVRNPPPPDAHRQLALLRPARTPASS